MFAGAAFTDQADIAVDADVVNTLVSLGVIEGYTDGSFRPDDTVTRAEMAKMIYTVRTGRSDASAYNDDATTFTDIGDHWARGYIKYCNSMGIIAGHSATRFAPDDTVTTQEAAKMLLVTLGYNADTAGLVGAGWGTKTNALADENGLLTDVNNGTTQGLPRQYAAQLIYNAINAHTVVYRDGAYTNWSANGTEQLPTIGERYMGLIRTNVTVDGDSKSISSLKDGQMRVTVAEDGNEAGTNGSQRTITYTVSDIESLVGMTVDVLWKESNDRDGLDKDDTIYGMYEDGSTETVIATSDDIDTADSGEIEINGTDYDVATIADGTTVVVYNQGGYADVKTASGTSAESIFEGLKAQNGDTIKFILNDEGEVTKAYVTQTKLGTVTAVSSSKVTISGLGTIEIDGNSVYSDVAKDDVVTYAKYYNTTLADAYVVVEKAEVVSGEVTSYKGAESVTVDGDVYKIYNKANMPGSVAGESGITAFDSDIVGETVDLYLVNGYVGAAVQTTESATNYSVVIDKNDGVAGSTMNPLKVEVLSAADEKSTLVVSDKGDIDLDYGDIITYTMSGDEAKVTKEVDWTDSKAASTASFYNDTAKTLEGTVTSADCVLFVQTTSNSFGNGAEFKAYNIRNLKDIDGASKSYIRVVDDSKVVAALINLGATPSGSTSDVVYGIVTEDVGYVKIDDTGYNQYKIWAGEEYTVNIEDGASNDTLAEGTIYGFAPSADDLYDDNTDFASVSKSDLSSVTVDGSTYKADVVWVDSYDESEQLLTYFESAGSQDSDGVYPGATKVTKAVADDVVITYVDVDNDAAGDEVGVETGRWAQTGYADAIIIMDDDGVITHIIVESSGEGNVYDA